MLPKDGCSPSRSQVTRVINSGATGLRNKASRK